MKRWNEGFMRRCWKAGDAFGYFSEWHARHSPFYDLYRKTSSDIDAMWRVTLTATQSDIFKGIVGKGTTSLKSGRFLQVVKRIRAPRRAICCREKIMRMWLVPKEETVFAWKTFPVNLIKCWVAARHWHSPDLPSARAGKRSGETVCLIGILVYGSVMARCSQAQHLTLRQLISLL